MFIEPTIGEMLTFRVHPRGSTVDQITVHASVISPRAKLVLAASDEWCLFSLTDLGNMRTMAVDGMPLPVIAYEYEVRAGQAHYLYDCLMAHSVVVDLLWHLQRMEIPRWAVAGDTAVTPMGAKWTLGQAIALADLIRKP